MRKLISLAAAVLASASAATAQSLVFGVDFGSGPTYSGTGVLGETFSGAIGTEHIAYSNGQDTGVTVNLNGPLGGSAGAFDAPGDGSNALFEDGVAIGNRGPAPGQTNLDYEIQAVLAGLAPNTTYNVAVYAGSDGNLYSAAGSSQIVDFGSGGSNDVIQTITENTSTPNYRSDFILGEDYALSTETTDGNGDLTFSVQGENSADPILNGFGISLATTVSGTPTWLTNGSGDWNSANNWGGTVPNGIDAQASFLGAITANTVVYTTTPITVGTMTFNNSAASYSITGAVGASLTFQVSTGSALVDVQAGTHELNLPLILASDTTFQTDAPSASLIIGNPITINPGITLTTTGTGTVTYDSTITLQSGAAMSIAISTYAHALSLAAGSTVFLPATLSASKTVLQLDSLTDSGTLDLNNNDLIIHGGSLAAVTAGVAIGYNGGTWTGTGITSSSAADDPTHLHALGIMAATTAGTFEGAAVAAGDVLVKYTYYGDANLDGQVDASDYSLIDNGYLNHLTGWSNGDFNYDGVVNGSDYTLIDNAFNTQGAQISTEVAAATDQISSVSAVPEPLTSSLLAFGTVFFLGRRRRSH